MEVKRRFLYAHFPNFCAINRKYRTFCSYRNSGFSGLIQNKPENHRKNRPLLGTKIAGTVSDTRFPAFLTYVIASIYSHNNFSFSLHSDYFLYPFLLQSFHRDRARFATQSRQPFGALSLVSYSIPAYLLSKR